MGLGIQAAALWLAWAGAGSPLQDGSPQGDPGEFAFAPSIEQRLTLTPDEVRVGEPLRVRAEVWHPAGTRVEFSLPEADPESGWWWQDLSPFASRPLSEEVGAQWLAVAEWTLVPLEQASARGEAGWSWFEGQTLPLWEASLFQGEQEFRFNLGGDDLTVKSNLGPEDGAPPPLRGLPDPRPALSPAELWRRAGWVAGASFAVFLAGLWLTLRGTRARPKPEPEPTPRERLERIAALRDREANGEQRRDACFELTALCRAAVDRRHDRARAHLTDDEWLEHVRRTPGEANSEWIPGVERLLRLCQRAKYAGEPPSGWALEELHGLADSLLKQLDAPTPEEPQVAVGEGSR